MDMPDCIDDQGNIWVHGTEGLFLSLKAESVADDASGWSLVFRTKSGFERAFAPDIPNKRLTLTLTVEDCDAHFPLGRTEVEQGEPFAIVDQTDALPSMVLQGYANRYGFE